MTWFLDTLRFIGMVFVRMVFWLVEQLLQTIVDLANAPLFSDTIIDIFSRRIYVILGLVMVFKLMISFIQILIDPDAMSDKEKGVGNVLKRVVISMALIVLVPSIFKMARDVQGYILPIIPKVVLGIQSDQNIDDPVSSSNVGSVMAWYSFLPFFDYQNEACNDGSIQKLVGDDTSTYEIYSVSTAADNINTKDSCSTNSNKYKYYCNGIVIVVGAFLLYSFVLIAVQIAIRTIKFGLCELVAPIPIASYIDPKTSKSTFDKWIHTSIKVYLDLFIQLIAIYFVVFVFQTFVSNKGTMGAILQNVGNDTWRASLVILFIIIGLTQFIKQFPKFLSDMLGISTDGEIGKILKSAALATAAPLGATVGAAGNIAAGVMSGKGVKASLRSGAAGFASGMFGGARAALTGKNAKDVFNAETKRVWNRRNQRAADNANGLGGVKGWATRMGVAARDWAKIDDDITLSETIQKSIDATQSADKAYKATITDKMGKNASNLTWNSMTTGGSKNIKKIQKLLSDNSTIVGTDSYLNDIYTALNKTGSDFGKKSDGTYLTYGDLSAIRASAHNLGLSELEAQLGANGDLFLALQKEMQNDGRKGRILNASGSRSEINDDPEVQRKLKNITQTIAANYANIGLTSYEYKDASGNKVTVELNTVEDWRRAFEEHPSEINNALDMRAGDISDKMADSLTAAARASNQRHKNDNNN